MNYRIKIEIDRADNGWYMHAYIAGRSHREVYSTKEELYSKLDDFREILDEVESNRDS